MQEVWKDVKGYEGLYQISSNGRVKSVERFLCKPSQGQKSHYPERMKNTFTTKKGYETVSLSNGRSQKTYRVSRLVAEAFLPNPNNLPTVDHINRITTDNRVENLRWASYQTQIENREIDYSKRKIVYAKGKEHCNSKQVRCIDTDEVFDCIKAAGIKYNVNPICISLCARGRRKTAGKLRWRFE